MEVYLIWVEFRTSKVFNFKSGDLDTAGFGYAGALFDVEQKNTN